MQTHGGYLGLGVNWQMNRCTPSNRRFVVSFRMILPQCQVGPPGFYFFQRWMPVFITVALSCINSMAPPEADIEVFIDQAPLCPLSTVHSTTCNYCTTRIAAVLLLLPLRLLDDR